MMVGHGNCIKTFSAMDPTGFRSPPRPQQPITNRFACSAARMSSSAGAPSTMSASRTVSAGKCSRRRPAASETSVRGSGLGLRPGPVPRPGTAAAIPFGTACRTVSASRLRLASPAAIFRATSESSDPSMPTTTPVRLPALGAGMAATGLRHRTAAWKLTDPKPSPRLSADRSEPRTTISAPTDNWLSTGAGSPGCQLVAMRSAGYRAANLPPSRSSIARASATASAYCTASLKYGRSGTTRTRWSWRPSPSALCAAQSAAPCPASERSAPATTSCSFNACPLCLTSPYCPPEALNGQCLKPRRSTGAFVPVARTG